MTAFPTRSFENKLGHSVTGELVLESSNAWQVAVNGEVQVLLKDAWTPKVGVDGYLGSIFGGLR